MISPESKYCIVYPHQLLARILLYKVYSIHGFGSIDPLPSIRDRIDTQTFSKAGPTEPNTSRVSCGVIATGPYRYYCRVYSCSTTW